MKDARFFHLVLNHRAPRPLKTEPLIKGSNSHMKNTITATTAAVFLLIPALCFSAYLIHLKDGRQFTTDRYREAGGQVRFKRYGGEVGVPRDLVKKIEVRLHAHIGAGFH